MFVMICFLLIHGKYGSFDCFSKLRCYEVLTETPELRAAQAENDARPAESNQGEEPDTAPSKLPSKVRAAKSTTVGGR